jgi:hypothetical protein
MSLFRSTDRSDIAGARVDMPERLARRPQKSLAGDRQADTSRVALEQRRAEFIFHVPNSAADGRFFDIECSACLAETPVFHGRHEIPEVVELDTTARQLRYQDFIWSLVAPARIDVIRPIHDQLFPSARRAPSDA